MLLDELLPDVPEAPSEPSAVSPSPTPPTPPAVDCSDPLAEPLDPGPFPPAVTERSCGDPIGFAVDSGVEANLQEVEFVEEELACGVVAGEEEGWWSLCCRVGPGVELPLEGPAEPEETTAVVPGADAANSLPFCKAATAAGV